jgi:hypothetical protein
MAWLAPLVLAAVVRRIVPVLVDSHLTAFITRLMQKADWGGQYPGQY